VVVPEPFIYIFAALARAPQTFRTFLKVERDFYYHDCLRGADYYAAPFPTWPKFMIVITRTNLSLNKPAAEGFLDFNYLDFKRRI